MTRRLDYRSASPEALQTYRGLESYVRGCGLDARLLELVRTRASQINGCGYCIDMHTKDARAAGEDEQRLYLLAAWREAPCYSERERAALAWAEALTLIAQGEVPDALYDEARRHFEEKELLDLTLAVIAINGWNRIAIAFRAPVGSYQAPRA
ncbi:MAG TPA: carboxymuconolactone decarboxylase family protein [Burkholderiales bacterium]|nr:carboxymuconolactone decarboxylase family protein [Burkholderiales bacterium]